MNNLEKHIVSEDNSAREALEVLNSLTEDMTLFIIDRSAKLVGSLTDGDIRRALLKEHKLSDPVRNFMNRKFHYLLQNKYDLTQVDRLKKDGIDLVPVVNEEFKIINVINLKKSRSALPVDAMIMAGGFGKRLMPLTENTPKPLLKVGEKPIIEHNIDRLILYGINKIHISVNYLANQIINYFEDGTNKNIKIDYIKEDKPLGTIGALGLVENLDNDYVLLMNSDILTNIDYEDFFRTFIETNADMAIASIPYKVNVPYAVLETSSHDIKSFKEKPTYTYYSNGGIYLFKKKFINEFIPKNQFFNATDLMEKMIEENKKVIHFPLLGYWLDIGKHEDYSKAQEDIKHIKF